MKNLFTLSYVVYVRKHEQIEFKARFLNLALATADESLIHKQISVDANYVSNSSAIVGNLVDAVLCKTKSENLHFWSPASQRASIAGVT